MRKKALLALVLALTLLLSGCNLIVKDQEKDDNTAIVTLGDTVVTKKAFNEKVNTLLENYYNSNYYYYYLMGYNLDITDPELVAEAREAVVSGVEESIIRDNKLQEWNMADYTDEDAATVEAQVQEELAANRDYVKANYYSSSDLEGEELEAEVDALLKENGITEETLRAGFKEQLLNERFMNEIVKDVTVADDEVTAKFDALVEADKTSYEAAPGTWATAFNSAATLYYTPEGVRMVKQILVKYTDEDQAAIDSIGNLVSTANSDVNSAETALEYLGITDFDAVLAAVDVTVSAAEENTGAYYTGTVKTEITDDRLDASYTEEQKQQCLALVTAVATENFYREELAKARADALTHLDAEADDIIAKLDAGADWDALMAEKTQDPGMQEGASTAETGYAIASGMSGFDTAFVDGALAIANVGDYSGKVIGEQYGYYIIKYVADAEAGAAVLTDETAATLKDSLLSEKQDVLYDETLTKWIDEAGFKVNLGALD